MPPKTVVRWDPLQLLSGAVGAAALAWLGPLMIDQFVLFADQDQARRAAESRAAMAPAGVLLICAAALLAARGRRWHAAFALLPALAAIPLAWLMPAAGYQLLAYGITAPLALGALLAAAIPIPSHLPTSVIVGGLVTLGALSVMASPFLALMGLIVAFTWWRMPHSGPPSFLSPGWR